MSLNQAVYSLVELTVTDFNKDLLSAALFESGCSGIEECSEEHWRIYFSQSLSVQQQQHLREKLNKLNPASSHEPLVFSTQPQQDWNAEWKKHFQPLQVTSRIWVAPPWELPQLKKGEVQLIIDPQMAFGTGSHESTQLMIQAMEKYLLPDSRVLDAGTGSGILAILAKKLGASEVFAFDVEVESIDNARHNALINREKQIDFNCGNFQVIPVTEFDVILANINRNVLLQLMPNFRKVLRNDGLLILSGIMVNDESSLQQAVADWSEQLEKFEKNGWISLVLKKKFKRY
jgi:ribosomal protein L11 methyltransferase